MQAHQITRARGQAAEGIHELTVALRLIYRLRRRVGQPRGDNCRRGRRSDRSTDDVRIREELPGCAASRIHRNGVRAQCGRRLGRVSTPTKRIRARNHVVIGRATGNPDIRVTVRGGAGDCRIGAAADKRPLHIVARCVGRHVPIQRD